MKPFKQHLISMWPEFLIPIGGPLVVFVVSYFATNIGWRAIPMGIIVMLFCGLLQTIKIYNRWASVENLINDIKKARQVKGDNS